MKIKIHKVSLEDERLFKDQFDKFNREGFNFAYKYDPSKPFSDYLEFLLELKAMHEYRTDKSLNPSIKDRFKE